MQIYSKVFVTTKTQPRCTSRQLHVAVKNVEQSKTSTTLGLENTPFDEGDLHYGQFIDIDIDLDAQENETADTQVDIDVNIDKVITDLGSGQIRDLCLIDSSITLFSRFYVRVGILLTRGKLLPDRIISLLY